MDISEVIKLVEKHSPMVRFEDLKVLIELLNYTKPKSILELGTGVGGWILAINEALDDDISFIGYENFKWDKIGQQFTDIKQLETQLRIVSKNNKTLSTLKIFVVILNCIIYSLFMYLKIKFSIFLL